MNEKTRKFLWLGAVAVFVLFCAVVGWFAGIPMIRLAEDPESFRIWVDHTGIWGKLAFITMVVIQVIVAFIPGEPLELAAGYAFGAVEGTVLSVAGILLGSWIVFLLVRRFGVRLVQVFFSDREIKSLQFLKDPRKTKVVAFLLMMIPGTPKDFLSYFAGLTKLTTAQWLAIVAIARIPSILTSTLTGAAAGERNFILAGFMTVVTLVVSGAGLLYYRRLCKEERETTPDSQQQRRAG